MKVTILVCIDDTDNVESIGTGELLEYLCREWKKAGLAETGFISRHQLFVHADIPYTSHNSSMCVSVVCEKEHLEEIIELAQKYLEINAAEGSDPGLCVVWPEKLNENEKDALIHFGKRAKVEVLQKEDAYSLAIKYATAVHLSEHGGTGMGVIGALAGCGLRLFGSDGRLKGKIRPENPEEILKVSEVCERYGFGGILTEDFQPIDMEDSVESALEIKPILWNHVPVVLVEPSDTAIGSWKIISKNGLNKKRIGR